MRILADDKKGVTVKIDADLHAEVRQFVEQNGMTMAEFVTLALVDELHPKIQQKEKEKMTTKKAPVTGCNDGAEKRLEKLIKKNFKPEELRQVKTIYPARSAIRHQQCYPKDKNSTPNEQP